MKCSIKWIFLLILILSKHVVSAQEEGLKSVPPLFGIKTNLLYDATTTMNLGLEFRMSPKLTLDLSANYNPWVFNNEKKIKHVLVQPEARYWFCEAFNGTFMGIHGHWGKFNVSGFGTTDYAKDHRFQGWFAGGGLTLGHQWILTNRFSLETTIGVGYAYIDYDTFECGDCGDKIKEKSKHYIGPTKAGISLIYMIK